MISKKLDRLKVRSKELKAEMPVNKIYKIAGTLNAG
jgi:hypothetical protein